MGLDRVRSQLRAGRALNAAACFLGGGLGKELLSLRHDLVNVANHVEGTLGQVIVLAAKDFLESGDGLGNGDKLARVVGEHLSDLEGLGQEPLNLPRPRDLDLVLLRQLIHTQDSNDILKGLVVLQQLLDVTGNTVVLSSENKEAAGRHTRWNWRCGPTMLRATPSRRSWRTCRPSTSPRWTGSPAPSRLLPLTER